MLATLGALAGGIRVNWLKSAVVASSIVAFAACGDASQTTETDSSQIIETRDPTEVEVGLIEAWCGWISRCSSGRPCCWLVEAASSNDSTSVSQCREALADADCDAVVVLENLEVGATMISPGSAEMEQRCASVKGLRFLSSQDAVFGYDPDVHVCE